MRTSRLEALSEPGDALYVLVVLIWLAADRRIEHQLREAAAH